MNNATIARLLAMLMGFGLGIYVAGNQYIPRDMQTTLGLTLFMGGLIGITVINNKSKKS